MKLNPNALVLLAFTAAVGYLVSETLYGTIAGLAVGLGLGIVASVIHR